MVPKSAQAWPLAWPKAAHSDKGGSDDQMSRINLARDRALAQKEVA